MYNKDNDRTPSKPLIVSASSAHQHLAFWLRENNLSTIEDRDGLVWELLISSETLPSTTDPHAGEVHLTIAAILRVDAPGLVATKTLDAHTDTRLLALIGDDRITLHLRPVHHVAKSLEDARLFLTQAIPEIKTTLNGGNLADIKRQLIGRWLDKKQVFGYNI